MNPSWVKTQADRQKVYREYMASLNLEQKNIEKTANAIKTKDLTGVSSAIRDTRTTSEKYMDIYRLRNELQSGLNDLMSPDESAKVVSELTEDEIQFGRTQLQAIIRDLKPRFELGVPSIVFINYLRKLLQKFILTEGVENVVGQQAGAPSNSLLSSFADIRTTRANLERLQQTINRVQSQLNIPNTSTSMELVPFKQIRNEIQNTLLLLPTPEELEELNNLDLGSRDFLYDVFTDIERFFPDSATIENIIQSIVRAGQRRDLNEITDIINSIENQIRLSQEQEDGLRQIQDLANTQTEEQKQESRSGGRRVEITGDTQVIRKSKKPKAQIEAQESAPQAQAQAPTAENIKTYRIADKELAEGDNKKLESVEYKPLTREAFIKLSQGKKEGYIAKALMAGDIGTAYGEVNEKDDNDNYYQALLTPKLVLTNFREGEGGQKRRPRFTSSQLIDIFDRYLANKATTEDEPIMELSGSPSKERLSSNISAVSQNTPAGVVSLFSPQSGREKKGKGIKGRGLGRNRVEGRIEREPEPRSAYSFAPFGRYIINTNKLSKCILTINTKTGKSLPRLKSRTITKALSQIFKEIAKSKEITNDMTDSLTDEEIDILYNTLNECHLLSKYNTPTSQNLSNTEKELNRFMILKGQISAGQNNEAVVREFKALLLKYMKKGQIPRGEGYDILEELLILGY
jgi:hypothetical protein